MKFRAKVWKIFVAIAGATVILTGAALLVLPGPGWVVIIIGLAILASEFAWAEHWLNSAKHFTKQNTQRIFRKNRSETVDKHHDKD